MADEVVAVFFFFWVRAAGTATDAVGTTAASFSFFLLFIGRGGGAKGFLEVFAMWDRGIAAKRLADDYHLDYGGAHVISMSDTVRGRALIIESVRTHF